MKTSIEIERKFLLKQIPFGCDELVQLNIVQHYVRDDDGNYRIRATYQDGDEVKYEKFYKTFIKEGVYEEKVFDITKDEFFLLARKKERSISKKRILMPVSDGLKWEVDVFDHPLTLVVAEIEVPNLEHPIIMPDNIKEAMIMEVTQFRQFTNYALAIVQK